MDRKTLRRWALPALILMVFSILLGPMSAFVQGAGLAELPLTEQYVNKYQGNYCIVTNGGTLIERPRTTFTVNVPGQPIAAFWNWSGRYRSERGGTLPPNGDNRIRILATLGDGTVIDEKITATLDQSSDPKDWVRWYAYVYSDEINQFARQGVNEYRVSGFSLLDDGQAVDTHGVALTVVYESEDCPLSQVELDYGLDTFYWDRDEPFGPDSSVACVQVPPSSVARTMNYTMIVAGVKDEERPNSVWVASINTSSDALPDSLVDQAFATEFPSVFGKGPRQWDIYRNQLTIDPYDNYACFQIESPRGNEDPGGISGGWLNLSTTVEVPFGSIGDLVWRDDNGNGAKDPIEQGLAGIKVILTPANGPQQVLTTGSDGSYLFPNLPPSTYAVTINTSSGPLAGGNWLNTGDPDAGNDDQSQVVLAHGMQNLDQDFGYQPAGSIGDTVWNDINSNGAIDGNEQGIGGVKVTLSNSQGVVDVDVTDPNGTYSFLNLAAGQYTVTVDTSTLPANMSPTYDPDDIDTPHIVSPLLGPGEDRADIDFGYRSLLDTLGDTVWNDLNGNGVQDAGEPGISGVIVILTDSTGAQQTAVTNGNGFYNFTDLPEGTYTVSIDTGTLPGGYEPTYNLDGIQTPNTTQVTLVPGQDRDDVDFGYMPVLGSMGDTVWMDHNGNGLQEPGELGIPAVTVILTASDGNRLFKVTDGDGLYTFDNVPAGQYAASIDIATLPANLQSTHDLDGIGTPNKSAVTLSTAQHRTDVDFGYQLIGSLGDRVWNDINGNGIQDGGELGISGVTMLLSGPGITRSTVTDINGGYTFSDLPAGDYTVAVSVSTLPIGLNSPTYNLDGIATPNTTSVVLDAGENRTDVDFGYQTPTAIDDGEPDDGDNLITVFLPVVSR